MSLTMSSMPGTHRTRAGVEAERGLSPGAGTAEDEHEFHTTTPLAPVPRRTQAGILVAAFLTISLSIGYNQSYGIFQEYYLSARQDMLVWGGPGAADRPTALLAFVGTLGSGLTWAGSIAVNPLLSRIEHAGRLSARLLTLTGVALMALGVLLASFATRVWHLLLTQGLVYGLGSSLLYFPLLGPAPEYFSRHRGTALGLILSGGGVGSLVLGPALRALLSALGGRWTLRILAGLFLVVGAPIAWAVPPSRFPATSETPLSTPRRRTHVSAALLTTPAFLFAVAAALCQSAGAQLPLSFIPSYTVALGQSAATGATLLAASNAVNAVARILTGYAGDRLGRLNLLVVTLVAAAAAVGALWGLSVASASTPLWLAFIVLYSFAAGGYNALFPATIADVFGIRSYAAVNGFLYFVRGCGTMLGSPVGGVLIGHSKTSRAYAPVVAWDGALLVGSAVCIVGVRWADAVRRGWAWRA